MPYRQFPRAASLIAVLALAACPNDEQPITNLGDSQPPAAAGSGGPAATLGEPTEITNGLDAPLGADLPA